MLFCLVWLLVPWLVAGKQKFVSLQRMDAIADLAALALKYFSEDQYLEEATRLKSVFATSEAVTAVAMELSGIWDETGSAVYTLTRMAKLIDDREAESGQFTSLARIVRAMAASSLQRNVHMSVAGSEEFDYDSYDSGSFEESNEGLYKSASPFDQQLWRIEELYRSGELAVADGLVQHWIQGRWTGASKGVAFSDLNGAAARGHYATLSAFVLFGRAVPALTSFLPQEKAEIAQNLMQATDAQLPPVVMKWLLTMDTFREDQLKLLKLIEEAAQATLKSGRRNSITELFAEIEQIPKENNVKYLVEIPELSKPETKLEEAPKQERPSEASEEKVHNTSNDSWKEETDDSKETKQGSESTTNENDQSTDLIELETEEDGPITSQESSDDTTGGNGPWFFLLGFIVFVILILCVSIVVYFVRNFRMENISHPSF